MDRTNSPVLGSPKSLKEPDQTEPYHPYLDLDTLCRMNSLDWMSLRGANPQPLFEIAESTLLALFDNDNRLCLNLVIELIQTKEYSDENWHEWKDRMKRVFINCDITGYITGSVK
jgi:hypothetical protein